MSIADKLDSGTRQLKRKLSDTYLHHVANDLLIIRVELIETKFNGVETIIHDGRMVQGYVDLPSSEVPITFGSSNQNSHGIHLLDLLPVFGFFKFSDDIRNGDIILSKINVEVGNAKPIIWQVVDMIGKGYLSVLWKQYVIAPPTITMSEYPKLVEIIDNYILS